MKSLAWYSLRLNSSTHTVKIASDSIQVSFCFFKCFQACP